MKKTNDLYVRMMSEHPIQKEWKPKHGAIIFLDMSEYNQSILSISTAEFYSDPRQKESRDEVVWLPQEEQWQEKYAKEKPNSFMIKDFMDYVLHSKQTLPDGLGCSDGWTIIWCLFVSKEIWNLEWDWEKNVWRKIR